MVIIMGSWEQCVSRSRRAWVWDSYSGMRNVRYISIWIQAFVVLHFMEQPVIMRTPSCLCGHQWEKVWWLRTPNASLCAGTMQTTHFLHPVLIIPCQAAWVSPHKSYSKMIPLAAGVYIPSFQFSNFRLSNSLLNAKTLGATELYSFL